MNEQVTISRNEYDRLVSASEDLADLQSVREYLADPKAGMSSERVKRMIDGESPLKLWREQCGLTQSDLANKSGVDRVQIGDIEKRGKTGSVPTLQKLAAVLKVSIDDLVS